LRHPEDVPPPGAPLPPDVAVMTAGDLKRRLDQGGPVAVLDVREDEERAFCAIPLPPTTADLHIPMGRVSSRLAEIRRAAAAAPLVVYCHLGMRSLVVARWLASHGVEGVHNLEGGIDAWSATVDPGVPRY
jgi:rhodanese-related sulfurtransferase